jgi:hypothetical protein
VASESDFRRAKIDCEGEAASLASGPLSMHLGVERRIPVRLGGLFGVLGLASACAFSACEPTLVVGSWLDDGAGAGGMSGMGGMSGVSGEDGEGGAGTSGEGGLAGGEAQGGAPSDGGAGGGDDPCGGGAPPAVTDPIAVPWSTGFENGFCDFERAGGRCFGDGTATYELVDSPVRSGQAAAAFTIDTLTGYQTRCLLQGELPREAYYGAWYYVPSLTTNNSVWNLFHFRGGDPSAQHGLWDVSLRNGAGGRLEVYVYDFLRGVNRIAAEPRPIPIGAWFHLEFYFLRAADATGAIALYQDGELIVEASGIITDDSNFGQWYVGNIANALFPTTSTVYVDDITIETSR